MRPSIYVSFGSEKFVFTFFKSCSTVLERKANKCIEISESALNASDYKNRSRTLHHNNKKAQFGGQMEFILPKHDPTYL